MGIGSVAVLLLLFVTSTLSWSGPSSVSVQSVYQAGHGIYKLRWALSMAEDGNITGTTSWIATVRSPEEFESVAPSSSTFALDQASGKLFTMALLPSTGAWHVCSWFTDPLTGSSTPTCSDTVIAPPSSGEPTSMVYLGALDDLLLIAFPEAGDVLAVKASTLKPLIGKWTTGLATPVSLAYNPITSTVYVALLDGGAVVRFDVSGGTSLDPPNAPWISVSKPRFILSNHASPSLPTSGEPAFFVMCMAPLETEVHFFDSNGNSLGSTMDIVSEWVCDEPGADPNSNSIIPRVTSIALDPSTMTMSVAREDYDVVDYYALDSSIPRKVSSPFANSHPAFLNPLGMYTTAGLSKPSGIVDTYQFLDAYTGRQVGVYLRCDPSVASGATLLPIKGMWGCTAASEGALIIYDDVSVYSVYLDMDNVEVCFAKYVYVVPEDKQTVGSLIEDTFLLNGDLYVLHSDGRVIQLSDVCNLNDPYPSPVTTLNTTLNVALLAVPQNEFIVRSSDHIPCIMTRYGINCNGSTTATSIVSEPVCQQKTNGVPLSGVMIGYNNGADALLVTGTDSSGDNLFVEIHQFSSNGTDTPFCAGPYPRPENTSSLRLVIDSDSGAFGWVDASTGALYEINTDTLALQQVARSVALPDLGSGTPPIGAQQWTLNDVLGQAGRFPVVPTSPPSTNEPTVKPENNNNTTSSGRGMIIALIVLGCIVLVLVVLIIFYVAALRRRRRAALQSNGSHAEGHGSTTYRSDEEERSPDYCLPPLVRRRIRQFCCCFDCCYSSDGYLCCCRSCLGGRLPSTRPYAKMGENDMGMLRLRDEEEGDSLPSTQGVSARPMSVVHEDRGAGGTGLEEIQM